LIVLIIEKPGNSNQSPVISDRVPGFDFEKTILLQTHPGAVAVKLQRARRALIGKDRERGIENAVKRPALVPSSSLSTECVSSSRCQIQPPEGDRLSRLEIPHGALALMRS
jgi:hypothetical protein